MDTQELDLMGASRLKPLTVKEIEALTSTTPKSIKHHSLGGVPGFVLVHTPAGHTSYGPIYRVGGQRKKLTLGNTKMFTLGEARKLAAQHRVEIETGGDPHEDKLELRRLEEEERRVEKEQQRLEAERQKLEIECMWEKYMQLVASQLRSRGEKDRVFRKYILAPLKGLCVTEIEKRHALEIIDGLVSQDKRRMASRTISSPSGVTASAIAVTGISIDGLGPRGIEANTVQCTPLGYDRVGVAGVYRRVATAMPDRKGRPWARMIGGAAN